MKVLPIIGALLFLVILGFLGWAFFSSPQVYVVYRWQESGKKVKERIRIKGYGRSDVGNLLTRKFYDTFFGPDSVDLATGDSEWFEAPLVEWKLGRKALVRVDIPPLPTVSLQIIQPAGGAHKPGRLEIYSSSFEGSAPEDPFGEATDVFVGFDDFGDWLKQSHWMHSLFVSITNALSKIELRQSLVNICIQSDQGFYYSTDYLKATNSPETGTLRMVPLRQVPVQTQAGADDSAIQFFRNQFFYLPQQISPLPKAMNVWPGKLKVGRFDIHPLGYHKVQQTEVYLPAWCHLDPISNLFDRTCTKSSADDREVKIRGQVFQADGSPATNQTVLLVFVSGHLDPDRLGDLRQKPAAQLLICNTDSDGNYRIHLKQKHMRRVLGIDPFDQEISVIAAVEDERIPQTFFNFGILSDQQVDIGPVLMRPLRSGSVHVSEKIHNTDPFGGEQNVIGSWNTWLIAYTGLAPARTQPEWWTAGTDMSNLSPGRYTIWGNGQICLGEGQAMTYKVPTNGTRKVWMVEETSSQLSLTTQAEAPASFPVLVELGGDIVRIASTDFRGKMEVQLLSEMPVTLRAWDQPITFHLGQRDAVLTNLVWFPPVSTNLSRNSNVILQGYRAAWLRGEIDVPSSLSPSLRLSGIEPDCLLKQDASGQPFRFLAGPFLPGAHTVHFHITRSVNGIRYRVAAPISFDAKPASVCDLSLTLDQVNQLEFKKISPLDPLEIRLVDPEEKPVLGARLFGHDSVPTWTDADGRASIRLGMDGDQAILPAQVYGANLPQILRFDPGQPEITIKTEVTGILKGGILAGEHAVLLDIVCRPVVPNPRFNSIPSVRVNPDADGNFAIGGLPRGEYNLTVQLKKNLSRGLPRIYKELNVSLPQEKPLAIRLDADCLPTYREE